MRNNDTETEMVEMPDGTWQPKPIGFTITETCTQEIYINPSRVVKKTRGAMDLVLQKLSAGSSITVACAAVNIKPSTLRYWRKNDEEFDQACKDAWEEGTGVYEETAFDRGKNGTVKDVYHKGEIVGEEIVHHDTLLLRTLERRAPEDWGKASRVELTGANGGPLRVQTLDLTKAAEELSKHGHSYLIEEYRALLEKPSGDGK